MTASEKIIKLYMKSKELFNQLESTPRDYGIGEMLYASETHTLVEIGRHTDINLTELANNLGISKSGASKFVAKLLRKKLILKDRASNNKKEVVFSLTEKGKMVAKAHDEFGAETFGELIKLVDRIETKEKEFLISFLNNLIVTINNVNTKG